MINSTVEPGRIAVGLHLNGPESVCKWAVIGVCQVIALYQRDLSEYICHEYQAPLGTKQDRLQKAAEVNLAW